MDTYVSPNNFTQVFNEWKDFCEEMRGKTLIIHELSVEYIRYSVLKQEEDWAGQYD